MVWCIVHSTPFSNGTWRSNSSRSIARRCRPAERSSGGIVKTVRGNRCLTAFMVKSPDPSEKPALRFNYLSTPEDRREWVECVRAARAILGQPAFASFDAGEISPPERGIRPPSRRSRDRRHRSIFERQRGRMFMARERYAHGRSLTLLSTNSTSEAWVPRQQSEFGSSS